MVKKYKFKKTKKADKTREELESLEDLPLVGGLFKGLGKFIDLVEKVEEAGGEIKKTGEIKGEEGKVKGIYGFSIKTGIGERPSIQTFGNIRPVKKRAGRKKIEVAETREPIVDLFDEKNHILIVAEIPGVSKEKIKLDLKGDILILEASDGKSYAKEILLPSPVDMKTKKVSYKNGILNVKLKKKEVGENFKTTKII